MITIDAKLKVQYLLNRQNNSRWSKNLVSLSIFKHDSIYKLKVGNSSKIFNLPQNVEALFVSHIEEGKATIQLIQPSIFVYIQEANPVHLKQLLNAIYAIFKEPTIDLESYGVVEKEV